jgi:hypothetical protein
MELKDFLNSINHDKKALLDNDENAQKVYPPFVVNRCLSYFVDTIFHSNEINCRPWLDNKCQFDFYRLSVRKKKRYCSWLKKETEENVAIIRQVYGYNESKAREVLNILSSEDINKLRQILEQGGIK